MRSIYCDLFFSDYMQNESNVTDYYKKTAMFWSDMIAMMSMERKTQFEKIAFKILKYIEKL